MARHRNIRKMNYADECDFDDIYGRSAEEEFCISPNTAAEFMYDRGANSRIMSAFLEQGNRIPEERESTDASDVIDSTQSQNDEARLQSCIDYIRDVVKDQVPEAALIDVIKKNDFDAQKALDSILTSQRSEDDLPKPQRQSKRDRRRNTGQEVSDFQDKVFTGAQAPNGHIESKEQLKTMPVSVVKGFHLEPRGSQTAAKSLDIEKSPSPSAELDDVKNDTTTPIVQKALKIKEPTSGYSDTSSKIDAVAEYEKQRGGGKELLNLVVIGHVDAGKSTLMGHLLCLLGAVSRKAMHKYEQESKKIGKASFAFAWVLDETGEERSRGITMDVGQFKFETDSKIVILLDAPGHKDFIPNMITGASQADVAILVVDATRGEFETGFELGGQTREHALLVRSLGVSQLVVAVNKLDTVNWSQERFNEISKKLSSFLKQAGFKDQDVSYIPCSGLTGENLKEPPKVEQLNQWYKGPTLLQQIDCFKSPERPVSKPFRMSIGDVFKGQGSGFSVSGRIETGFVCNGDKVLVMPQNETAQIKGMTIDEMPVQTVFAGDSAVLNLSNIDMSNIAIGCVLCRPNQAIHATTSFQARIVLFNIDVPVTKGFPVILHYQSLSEPAVVKKLISQLHKNTGEVIKKKPRCLGKQTSALIDIETARPICIEVYKDIKELGRFMLRSGGQTIAAGLITQIY